MGRSLGKSRREEHLIRRTGLTKLNSSLHLIRKHQSGNCDDCNEMETVDHVIFLCPKYSNERQLLRNELEHKGIKHMELKTVFVNSSGNSVLKHIFTCLHDTGM